MELLRLGRCLPREAQIEMVEKCAEQRAIEPGNHGALNRPITAFF
jgi:hypothetical protein